MRALTRSGQVDEVGFLDDERPVEPCLAERRLEARDPRFDLVGRNHRRRVCRTVILENGLIRTMDPSLPTARALALAGDRIVGGVGVHETALASPETVDLAGLTVLPGFTDSHVHFAQWSLAQRQVRLEGVASLDEAVARVAEVARGARPGRWLRGLGWRSGEWHPQVEPTRQALDAVTGDVPTALMAKDGHSIWINSAALAAANGDLQVPGGVVELDEHGEPTGVLREESAWHFRETYVLTPDDEWVDAMRAGDQARQRARRHGRARQGRLDGDPPLVADAARRGLALAARLAVAPVGACCPRSTRSACAPASGTICSGSATSRSSWTARSGRRRRGCWTAPASRSRAASSSRTSSAARRAQGSRSASTRSATRRTATRSTASRPRQRNGARSGLRPRIEHAQLVAEEDFRRFGEIGIAASVQFSHAPSDRDLADDTWAGMTDRAYAWRSLLDGGALLANGSDAPVEELDPLFGLRAGVARSIDEREGWHPEQAVTIEEALVASTVNPAWLAGDEKRRGSLVPGKVADLVVLDRDPVETAPEELADIRVVATMLGGRWVHGGPPFT